MLEELCGLRGWAVCVAPCVTRTQLYHGWPEDKQAALRCCLCPSLRATRA